MRLLIIIFTLISYQPCFADIELKHYIVQYEDGNLDVVASTGKIHGRIIQEAPKDRFGKYVNGPDLLKQNQNDKYIIDQVKIDTWRAAKEARKQERDQRKLDKISRLKRIQTECEKATGLLKDLCDEKLSSVNLEQLNE